MPIIHLPERKLIAVGGADARDFLERLITNDVETMERDKVVASALLTPQGKVLFDFLISETPDGFLIDIRGDIADDFIRRMTMYRLRANVTIDPMDDQPVHAAWGDEAAAAGVSDTRFPESAGVRRIYGAHDAAIHDTRAWDQMRIDNGIAESGKDYELSDAFPHDLLMDLNGGVSFGKGCFVGQEVVSRMKHRNTARRRVAIVDAQSALPRTGTPIEADGRPLGQLGTVADNRALAIVRTDRVSAALAAGQAVLAAGVPVTLSLPAWSGLSFPPVQGDAQSDLGD